MPREAYALPAAESYALRHTGMSIVSEITLVTLTNNFQEKFSYILLVENYKKTILNEVVVEVISVALNNGTQYNYFVYSY